MDQHDTLLRREAAEAPARVEAMLAKNEAACREIGRRLRAKPPRLVVTGARGSSDSAASYFKYLSEVHLGRIAASLGPSVRSIYGGSPDFADSVFLAISQSGKSPDLVGLGEAATKGGAVSIAVTNDPASPLARACTHVLPLDVGPEKGVAATKSYLASLASCLQIAAHWSERADLLAAVEALPAVLRAAAAADWRAAAAPLAAARSVYVVGRGPGLAAAQEMALKLKETCLIHAEAYSAAEVLHGPVAVVDAAFPTLVIGQEDAALEGLRDLARLLRAREVPTLAIGPAHVEGAIALPLAAGLPPVLAPIAAVQSFYGLVSDVARARGLDPDKPRFLRKITETT